MDGLGLWWLFERKRWPDELWKVGDRCYCSRCWQLGRGKVRRPAILLTHEQPEGPLFPAPDERTWKRIVNRQRS